jgi:hypothetical protein
MIEIRRDVLEEVDGPVLKRALQGAVGVQASRGGGGEGDEPPIGHQR